jgi:peroxiredoxin
MLTRSDHSEPRAESDPAPGLESEGPPESDDDRWQPPPAQPLRILMSLALIAAGAVLYGLLLTSFWSSPELGIHDRFPYRAYALIALSLMAALAGLRLSLSIWSPHVKLGLGLFGFFACVAIGVGGGRFTSYTLRGTLNPPFRLHLAPGDRFPNFALADQHRAIRTLHDSTTSRADITLIVVYRGDFCPFSRFELGELTTHAREVQAAGLSVVAISADPIDRSAFLGSFLHTDIPLLSDESESLLGPVGLIEHHRDGRPDNSIPAYFLVDREGVVRWLFTSPYYRELPRIETLLDAAASIRRAR